jgi:hypothetical protein
MSDKYPKLTELQQAIIEELLDGFHAISMDYYESQCTYDDVYKAENNILYAVNQMVGGERVDLDLTCIFLHEHKDDAQEDS